MSDLFVDPRDDDICNKSIITSNDQYTVRSFSGVSDFAMSDRLAQHLTVHILCVTCRHLEISVVFYVFCVLFFAHRSYVFFPYWSPTPRGLLNYLIRFGGLLYVIEFFKKCLTLTFRIHVGGRPQTALLYRALNVFLLLTKQAIKLQFFFTILRLVK